MLIAAINNGADAVYFGVPHWNARGRTEDFSFEDVEEMILYARKRGVRTFLAMNVLVFEREIHDLPVFLETLKLYAFLFCFIDFICLTLDRSRSRNPPCPGA